MNAPVPTNISDPAHQPLKNPWWSQILGVWLVTGMTCALGVGLLPFHNNAAIAAFIFAGISGLVALLGGYYARTIGRQLSAYRRGEYLVHWTYQAQEWDDFLRSPFAPRPPNRYLVRGIGSVTGLIYGFVLSGALSTVLWSPFPGENDSRALLVVLFYIGSAALAATVGWVLGVFLVRVLRRRDEQSRRSGEVYIGRGGLYLDGTVATWAAFGLFLRSVQRKETDPPILEFDVADIEDNTSVVHVPVPRGREAEAKEVIQELARGFRSPEAGKGIS
jgi:hypothetical protein